jgi:Domain of unknown function (DUF4157)
MGLYRVERYRVFAEAQPGPLPELELGPARDRFERAADWVACQVTGHPVPRGPYASGSAAPPPDPQQARGAVGGALDAGTRQAIRQASAGGQPAPGPLRAAMERALGADLSGVRIHADRRADELSRLLQARAFTTGQHVFFRDGAYDPVSPGGRALLAHELTHVVQQRGAAPVVQRDYQPEYQFPGRWQVSVGVGETVRLSVTNPNAGSLKWTDESPLPVGVLGAIAPSGEAVYTAGGEPGTATLVCRDGQRKEVHWHQFTILAPNGGYLRQAPGTKVRHLHGSWNVSFVGNLFLEPRKVSFHNIEFMEGPSGAQCLPSRRDWKVPGQGGHKAGRWIGVERALDGGDGSKCEGDDWVSSGNYVYAGPDAKPPGEPVTMTWSIPWLWRMSGTGHDGRVFTTVDHVAYDYGNDKARLTKGGVDVSAMAGDPSQWFYSVDDTLDRIKYYYGEYPPGYGASWPVVEARLRKFADIGPAADLLAAVRESTWGTGPDDFPPGTSLNDLIDIAATLWHVTLPK